MSLRYSIFHIAFSSVYLLYVPGKLPAYTFNISIGLHYPMEAKRVSFRSSSGSIQFGLDLFACGKAQKFVLFHTAASSIKHVRFVYNGSLWITGAIVRHPLKVKKSHSTTK